MSIVMNKINCIKEYSLVKYVSATFSCALFLLSIPCQRVLKTLSLKYFKEDSIQEDCQSFLERPGFVKDQHQDVPTKIR